MAGKRSRQVLHIPSSRRAVVTVWIIVVLIALAGIILLVWRLTSLQASDTDAHAQITQLKKINDQQDAVIAEANRRLIAAGKHPVKGPQGLPGATGPGPTSAQVNDAVALYCASTGVCSPSEADVALAVSRYCNNRGECKGPEGTAGTDGTNGTDGLPGETGATGPPPTDAQILDAVTTYCSIHAGCQGPAGQDGTNGTDGKDGSVVPGDYQCGTGFYLEGFTVAADGTVTLNCQPNFPPGGG
jgi:type II secretory pathway pseudopilin PulG